MRRWAARSAARALSTVDDAVPRVGPRAGRVVWPFSTSPGHRRCPSEPTISKYIYIHIFRQRDVRDCESFQRLRSGSVFLSHGATLTRSIMNTLNEEIARVRFPAVERRFFCFCLTSPTAKSKCRRHGKKAMPKARQKGNAEKAYGFVRRDSSPSQALGRRLC